MARFACQKYDTVDKQYTDYVVLVDQLSTDFHREKWDLGAPEYIDGRMIFDPDDHSFTDMDGNPFMDMVPFRLRSYRASLDSQIKTRKEIIEELDSRPASADPQNQPMDYIGEGYRNFRTFHFTATDFLLDGENQPYPIVKEFSVSIGGPDISGRLQTLYTHLIFEDTGNYLCEPMFYRPVAPEIIESLLGLTRETRRLIQAGLAAEGYDPGPLDGIFGTKTRAAIVEYQRRNYEKRRVRPDKRMAGYLVSEITMNRLKEAGRYFKH